MRLRTVIGSLVGVAFIGLIAPAAQANFVYWPNASSVATIGRAALDGTMFDNGFISTGNGSDPPTAVAADSQFLYWADGNDTTGRIGRASLDGSAGSLFPNFIPNSAGVKSPVGLAVTSTHLYWANSGGGIGRADLDGGHPNPTFINTAPGICGLAADQNFIYWSNNTGASIARAPLDGSSSPDLNFIPTPPQANNCGVASDGTHVYWDDQGHGIGRANVDGSGVDHSFIPFTSDTAGGVAVAPPFIFWSIFGANRIGRANLDGSAADNSFLTNVGPTPFLPAASPSNALTLGEPRLNKKKGTAMIDGTVQGPGVLVLSAARNGTQAVASAKKKSSVVQVQTTAGAAGTYSLRVKAKGPGLKTLNRKGKARVRIGVTFTPKGVAGVPNLLQQSLKLKRR
jgi:hypothetical protein